MADILLDSNVVVKAMHVRNPALYERIGRVVDDGHDIFLSTVSLMEIQVGILRSSNQASAIEKREQFFTLVTGFWEFDERDAWVASEIRHEQLRLGNTIGAFDLLIAAQAIRRKALLITGNVKEFSRVTGLRRENWTL